MDPQIRIVGNCTLSSPDGHMVAMPTRKSWGLLAYLCQSGERDVPREELAALLWPRGTETQARASLRQELAVLRKCLLEAGIDSIVASKERVRFEAAPGLIDALEIGRLLDLEDHAAWRQAVQLYRGDFLGDLNLRAAPFEEWLWLERQRLKNRVQGALQKLLERDMAGGDAGCAMATAERLLEIDPASEQAYRAMMRLLSRMSRRAEALRLYRQCTEILRRELDTEPSLATAMLAEQIRAEAGAPAGPVAIAPSRLPLAVVCLALSGTERPSGPPRDPEMLAQAQARFLETAERIVNACNGQVLPGLGDRVVAVFGNPEPSARDCEKAVQAALTLVAEPVSLSAGSMMWPRAGIAHEEMLISVSATPRAGSRLVGDGLTKAMGLLQLARGGQVVAEPGVMELLHGPFAADPPRGATALEPNAGVVIRRVPPRSGQPA